MKKFASNIKYTVEVDKIFSKILKDKYSIDTTGKELEELKKLREQYKEDFEAAKAQAKEKLGLKNPKYLEKEMQIQKKIYRLIIKKHRKRLRILLKKQAEQELVGQRKPVVQKRQPKTKKHLILTKKQLVLQYSKKMISIIGS